ncbi:lactonase family protein [Acidicapsa acidisoli]|uniref:lactonase family protein n=1 Tax=Acidicapsa acidisoli TaxID=1615681 RepID=UPI0021DFE750|nr:lactonase family protein [Acidicapsa acidisoli]
MKFGKVGQVVLVSAIALSVATLFTACSTLTVGFLYVPTTLQNPGQIEVYEVNSESGVLRTIPTSPFPSGGRNPLAEAVSPDFNNLYVANNEDNNIVQFGIGNDGKLYPQSTVNTPGTFPVALGVNGTYAYVVDNLGPTAGCSLTNPCPGLIAGYTIAPQTSTVNPGSLGLAPASCATVPAPSPLPDCTDGNPITNSNGLPYVSLQLSANDQTVLTPAAINITANGNYVYVTAYNPATSPFQGYLFAFSVGAGGSLTPVPLGANYLLNGQSTQMIPLPVGSEPITLTSDSASQYLYVVDELKNQIDTFSLQSGGSLTLLGTTPTGNKPSAAAMFKDSFLYVTNSLDSTVSAYSIASGSLTQIANYASSLNPVAITVDPKNIGFLYTVNYLGNSLSGYQINPATGVLINTQATPYLSSAQPSTITGIPHGGTATSGTAK